VILADTSIWIEHLRAHHTLLARLLDAGQILMHPFIVGELALSSIRNRDIIIGDLQDLPQAKVASDPEVLHFIRQNHLAGQGIGYVDAHLLASVRLTESALLWTFDLRLSTSAHRLGLATTDPL
jgi:predicted nucleic acid-binding protein